MSTYIVRELPALEYYYSNGAMTQLLGMPVFQWSQIAYVSGRFANVKFTHIILSTYIHLQIERQTKNNNEQEPKNSTENDGTKGNKKAKIQSET
jgi:hypothetical protein